jgi:hypothetical protein
MRAFFLIVLVIYSVHSQALTYEEARSDSNISRCQTVQDNMYLNEQARQDLRGSSNESARKTLKRRYKTLQNDYSQYDCKMVRNKLENSARKFGV